MLGLGLLSIFFGGFGLFMMHVTQSIPNRGWWTPMMRYEDPDGYEDWWVGLATLTAGGALLALAGFVFGI